MCAANLTEKCLFCNPRDFCQENQILLRSENLYLFAGLGQIVDGYILITPYRCDDHLNPLRCLADFPVKLLDELLFLRNLVSDFYQVTYSYGDAGMHFEHGRVNLCTQSMLGTRHCCHAHLCCYPVNIALWDYMHDLQTENLPNLYGLDEKCSNSQYLLIQVSTPRNTESPNSSKREQWITRIAIVPETMELTGQYFRRLLAQGIGEPELWDWSKYPMWERITKLKSEFRHWASTQDKYNIINDEDNTLRIDLTESFLNG